MAAYLGVMGPQDGVDLVVRLADHVVHRLGRRDISFTLIGSGDCFDDLVALSDRLDLSDFVTFTGRIPDADVSAILSTADVGISPDPKNPLNDLSTMNKTMEYMTFALPVVAFDLTGDPRLGGRRRCVRNPQRRRRACAAPCRSDRRRTSTVLDGRGGTCPDRAGVGVEPPVSSLRRRVREPHCVDSTPCSLTQSGPDPCAVLPAPINRSTALAVTDERWAGASTTVVPTRKARSRILTTGSTCTWPTAAFRSSISSTANNRW